MYCFAVPGAKFKITHPPQDRAQEAESFSWIVAWLGLFAWGVPACGGSVWKRSKGSMWIKVKQCPHSIGCHRRPTVLESIVQSE